MSEICATREFPQPSHTASRSWSRFVRSTEAGFGRTVDTLLAWQRRYRDRLHLLSLDDHMLHDIGISLADVEREASKPFWRP